MFLMQAGMPRTMVPILGRTFSTSVTKTKVTPQKVPKKAKTAEAADIETPVPKRRGRPPKIVSENEPTAAPKAKVSKAAAVVMETENQQKKRGRPPKKVSKPTSTEPLEVVPKKRGRPKKIIAVDLDPVATGEVPAETPVPKKRGRPKKSISLETTKEPAILAEEAPLETPKKRDRPKKIESKSEIIMTAETLVKRARSKKSVVAPEHDKSFLKAQAEPDQPKKRGRPKKAEISAPVEPVS